MEIRYRISPAEYAGIQKYAAKQIYAGNKQLKRLSFYDMALFLPYTLLMILAFLETGDWQDSFNEWYENNYTGWVRWILLIGIYVILYYATSLRPMLINKLVRQQVTDTLFDGELTVRIQEDGLYAANSLTQSLYFYSRIPKIRNFNQYLIIFIGTGHFIAVPYHAFSDENQRVEFENLLKSKIAPYESLSG